MVSMGRSFLVLCALSGLAFAQSGDARAGSFREAMPYYQMGLQSERAGNLEMALQNYREAIEIGGDIRATVGSLVRMARISMVRGDNAAAEKYLEGAIERDPQNSAALLVQAKLWLLQDKPRRAAKNFEDLSHRVPVAIPALVGLVEAARIQADPAVQKQTRQRLLSSLGENIENRARAAQEAQEDAEFFISAGKVSVSEFLAELAYDLQPSSSNKKFLALTRYQANNLDGAAELFRELQADPEFQDLAKEMLAQIEVQRKESRLESQRARFRELQKSAREAEIAGRLEEAIKVCEDMISFGKDIFKFEIGAVETSLAALKKRHAEKIAEDARSKAYQAMRSGQYAQAVQALRNAKIVVGPDLLLDGMLAEALLKYSTALGPKDQEEALREILGLESQLSAIQGSLPSSVLAATHARLGALFESQKRWAEAVRHYEMAKSRAADLPDLSSRLLKARIRANLPQCLSGLALLALAAGLIIVRWPRFHRTALAFFRYQRALQKNDKEKQLHALKDLVTLLPHRPDLRFRLADLALEKEDEELSIYLFEQLRREVGDGGETARGAARQKLFDLYQRRGDAEKLYALIDDWLKTRLDAPIRLKLLETRFDLELNKGAARMAFLTGQELLQVKPTPTLVEQMVDLARNVSDFKSAVQLFRTWLRVEPSAQTRISGEIEKMIPAAQAADEQIGRDLRRVLLEIHLKSGNQERAAELLEALLPNEKDPVPILQTLLKIYTGLKRAEAIFRMTRLMYEAQPASYQFGMKYAGMLRTRGEDRVAREIYLNLLPHHANTVELVKTLHDIGRAAFEEGGPEDLDAAARIFREIIGHSFLDTKDARLLLARSLMKKGQLDEAIAILQAIEGGGYPRIRAQSLVAEAFLTTGKAALAVEVLSKINFNDPQIPDDLRKEMRYLLAGALETSGQLSAAAEIFDKLILEDITYKDVKARHEKLAGVPRVPAAAGVACPKCKKPNPAGARFCSSCGAAVSPR